MSLPRTKKEKEAWRFALEAHRDQKRKFSGEPYFTHVRKVMGYVKQYDNKEYLAVAALLHDTVEDIEEITIEDIRNKFGKKVASLVKELTSKDKHVKLMGKTDYLVDKMFSMSDDALFIKLCDRLQNISDHYSASPKFRKKYYKETKEIIETLRRERVLQNRHKRVMEQIESILEAMDRRYFEGNIIKSWDFYNESIQDQIVNYFEDETDPFVDEILQQMPKVIKKKKLLYSFFRKFGSEFDKDIINEILEIKNPKYSYDLGGDGEEMPKDLQKVFLKAVKFELERYKDVVHTEKFFKAVMIRIGNNKELNKYEIAEKEGILEYFDTEELKGPDEIKFLKGDTRKELTKLSKGARKKDDPLNSFYNNILYRFPYLNKFNAMANKRENSITLQKWLSSSNGSNLAQSQFIMIIKINKDNSFILNIKANVIVNPQKDSKESNQVIFEDEVNQPVMDSIEELEIVMNKKVYPIIKEWNKWTNNILEEDTIELEKPIIFTDQGIQVKGGGDFELKPMPKVQPQFNSHIFNFDEFQK